MICSIRSVQTFNEQRSMNESLIWMNSSTSACELTFDWRNWMLDQSSRHRWFKSLALSLASRWRSWSRSQSHSLHERNSEYRTLILLERSCLKKNSALNARSQNIEHATVLSQLRYTKSQRIRKTICLRQSSDWERHAHILLHQYARWLVWFQAVYCERHLE